MSKWYFQAPKVAESLENKGFVKNRKSHLQLQNNQFIIVYADKLHYKSQIIIYNIDV